MWGMICHRRTSENFVKSVGKNHMVLLLSILLVKKMQESIGKGLITFLSPNKKWKLNF